MKFRLIDEEKSHHTVSRLARVLGVTAAGYHAWKKRRPCARLLEDERLKQHITRHFEASHGTYGAPRLLDDLADEGIRVSRKRVARLMRELGIAGVSGREGKPRRRKTAVPESEPATDLVRREFTADEPNQVWFADITYVPTWEGWLFLAVVMDACTKRIVRLVDARRPEGRHRDRRPWDGDDHASARIRDSCITRTAVLSTARSRSDGRCATRASSPRWAPPARLTTTP